MFQEEVLHFFWQMITQSWQSGLTEWSRSTGQTGRSVSHRETPNLQRNQAQKLQPSMNKCWGFLCGCFLQQRCLMAVDVYVQSSELHGVILIWSGVHVVMGTCCDVEHRHHSATLGFQQQDMTGYQNVPFAVHNNFFCCIPCADHVLDVKKKERNSAQRLFSSVVSSAWTQPTRQRASFLYAQTIIILVCKFVGRFTKIFFLFVVHVHPGS